MSASSHGVLSKMTTDLFTTYSQIHALAKQGYENEEKGSEPDYRLSPGEVLHNRYVVQCTLGKGSFGQVVRALDRRMGHDVAIKIIKRLKSFTELARNEIRLLNLLKDRDPQCHHHIVSITDWFLHDGHQCIVFEMLSSSLYDVLRSNEYRGLPISVVQHVSRQLLESLLFLQANDIMHCDLKPENVLLKSHGRFDIKLIDFGSSCFTNEQVYSYIQSRFYRSPEVLLGLPYDTSIDMWSLGCILVELLTGEVLLPGANEVEQIARMISILGMPPARLLRQATKTKQFFILEENGKFRFRHALPGHISGKTLSHVLAVQKTSRFTKARSELLRFLDLVERMLDYDATSRITPSEALGHVFLVHKTPGFVGRIRPRNFS